MREPGAGIFKLKIPSEAFLGKDESQGVDMGEGVKVDSV